MWIITRELKLETRHLMGVTEPRFKQAPLALPHPAMPLELPILWLTWPWRSPSQAEFDREAINLCRLAQVYLTFYFVVDYPGQYLHSFLLSRPWLGSWSMISTRWDAAFERWVSTVIPKLTSLDLSVAVSLIQDAAFVCSLTWLASTTSAASLMVRC